MRGSVGRGVRCCPSSGLWPPLPVKNGEKEKHTFSEPMTEQANGIVGWYWF